jgi:DNA (cytosine-5)-methyltransferase 1
MAAYYTRMGDSQRRGREGGNTDREGAGQPRPARHVNRAWDHYDFIPCGDGAIRPIEPGLEPVAHGVSARVGRLRGYGNAINPEVAAVFIESYLDCCEGVNP